MTEYKRTRKARQPDSRKPASPRNIPDYGSLLPKPHPENESCTDPGCLICLRKRNAAVNLAAKSAPESSITAWRLPNGLAFIPEKRFFSPADNGLIFAQGKLIHDETDRELGPVIVSRDKPMANPRVVWRGHIHVDSTQLEYKPLGDRTIDPASARRSITIRAVDSGGNERHTTVAVSVTRNTQRHEWLDPLGIIACSSPAMVGKYIRALADGTPDNRVYILGQGPIYTENGSLILVTLSGCYDRAGNVIDGYRADLSRISPPILRQMHDVMPPGDITPERVTAGLAWFENFLSMSRDYPEVPAAHAGQLAVSVLAPIDIRFWSAIYLHAPSTLGKTTFEKLVSAVQSPGLRDLTTIRPEINLGDGTGTGKGPKYRIPAFGLGTVSLDDAFKESNPPLEKIKALKQVDDIIRSREEGAAAIAQVDKKLDDIVASASGELCASIRVNSEGPPPMTGGKATSTYQRVCLIGGWSVPWHEVFNPVAFDALAHTLDDGYAGYSHMTLWAWAHPGEMETLYSRAEKITRAWECETVERVRTRYTGIVAGLLMIGEIAREHNHTFTDPAIIDSAISALQTAAERQAGTAAGRADLAAEFLSELRIALADGALAAMGRPMRVTGEHDGAYISPYIVRENTETGEISRELPTGAEHYGNLGLKPGDSRPVPKRPEAIEIYVKPPRQTVQGGRGKKDAHAQDWMLIMPVSDKTWQRVCRVLSSRRSRIDGTEFDPEATEQALTAIIPAIRAKTRYYAIPDEFNGAGKEDQSKPPQVVIRIPAKLIWKDE